MYKIIISFFIVISAVTASGAGQPDPRMGLKKSVRRQVVRIIDGDSLVLRDQTRVRLVGIEAPALMPDHSSHGRGVIGKRSAKMLSQLTLGKFVTLYFGGARRDRYGRMLAQLFLDNGLWVQGVMLKSGMARVYTFADNRAVVPEMLAFEQQARQHNRGLWALDYFKVKDQQTSAKYRDSFQLIGGRVKKVARVRGTYYLNFGADWRTDFTVVIKSAAARRFAKAGIDPASYQGKKIEVRGWLKIYNGPMIEATHPEQIVIVK
ncbi:MAG: thermonuclease family protein [Alphaproteobacteria bacterium]|nr:thermonuclease family protein [Alphaproteobacteria bacterium]